MPLEDIGLTPNQIPTNIATMAMYDLLTLRGQIDTRLGLKLEDMNLAEELAFQFQQAKSLYNDLGTDVPANQRAQVLNTTTAIIASITKSQTELYNAERLKMMEAAMIKALKTLPKENQEAFFDLYGKYLG